MRGRPRKTDPAQVLEKALKLFWQHGFEATSMNDVSQATGMAKPGLYANFGNKDELFCKALSAYVARGNDNLPPEYHSPDTPLRSAIMMLLMNTIDIATSQGRNCGCFLVKSLVETSDDGSAPARLARDLTARQRASIAAVLRAGQTRGELPADANIQRMAEFVFGQMCALATMAGEGLERPALLAFAETGLSALPFVEKG